MEQEVGGSSPPNCTSKINSLENQPSRARGICTRHAHMRRMFAAAECGDAGYSAPDISGARRRTGSPAGSGRPGGSGFAKLDRTPKPDKKRRATRERAKKGEVRPFVNKVIVVTSYEFGALKARLEATSQNHDRPHREGCAPEQARILAKRLAGDVVHGIDPAGAKTQKRYDQTVGELLDRYIRDHVRVMLKP